MYNHVTPRTLTIAIALLGLAVSGAYAQCPDADPPQGIVEFRVDVGVPAGLDASIAMDGRGRFVVGYEEQLGSPPQQHDVRVKRYRADGTPCEAGAPAILSTEYLCQSISHETSNYGVSLAVRSAADANIVATWTSGLASSPNSSWRLEQLWAFDDPYPAPVGPPPPWATGCGAFGDLSYNSAGVGVVSNTVRTSVAWVSEIPDDQGLLTWIGTQSYQTPTLLRTCSYPDTLCYSDDWAPCLAVRDDSRAALAWAEPLFNTTFQPPFDIRVAQFSQDGTTLGPTGAAGLQANPVDEDPFLSQLSPALAFRSDRLAVVWRGPEKLLCPRSREHIYLRLFRWGGDDSPPTDPQPLTDEIIVDSDPYFQVAGLVDANPSVAITLDENDDKLIVVWNTRNPMGTPLELADDVNEIHGQYFHLDGTRIGGEFLVTEQVGRLARSGQHTVVFGSAGQVAIAFTAGQTPTDTGVYVTLLPPGYENEVPALCIPGDINGDGAINGLDIQPFVNIFTGTVMPDRRESCAMDIDRSGSINAVDWVLFIYLLLHLPPPEADCNGNCRLDWIDVIGYGSADCNGDLIPDECQLCNDCPGNPLCLDCDNDGILDPCEEARGPIQSDCNNNGIDDAEDLALGTSEDCNDNDYPDECEPDCNYNAVPDGCDITEGTSEDCDGNGTPDECEFDCNENGIPDACDVLGGTSEDCNANTLPDECDIDLYQSLDCNENRVPDECDIALGTSADEDENGVLDECEGEQLLGGGESGEGSAASGAGESVPADGSEDGSSSGADGGSSLGEGADGDASGTDVAGDDPSLTGGASFDERLAAFEAWIIEQDFTGLSVPEQMRRIKRKMLELDLWP
ncbi:MAG: dockerin type I repeat-containing protein [Phycisphaerae bacterium]|nr:dockerin type I repeat-containing protein [Phycisphaerae bacterium]